MDSAQQQLDRDESRVSHVYTWPLQAVEIAGRCRDQYVGQLRDWLRFPLLLRLSDVHDWVEWHALGVSKTLSLERAKAAVKLVDGQETGEEARTRRHTVYESLLSKPWGFVRQQERDDEGVPQLDVRLQPNEVSAFQCLLALMQFHVFLHEIEKIVEGLDSRHQFFKLVHSTMDRLKCVVDGMTEVFVERGGGREGSVMTSHSILY
ncbi:uncharacterized protein QYS62_011620 [Fusarium acuminatum]|uniref:Uncharacterized protein n=1 Tax=Fusarium acuminatum TaxID=5515 RepID=A0ABZ2XCH5_9HYPO